MARYKDTQKREAAKAFVANWPVCQNERDDIGQWSPY